MHTSVVAIEYEKSNKTTVFMKFFLMLIVIFVMFFQVGSASALERDGRWLEYNGKYPYLIGYDLQQLFSDASYSEDQIKEKIDILAAYGTTAFRVWVNNWFMIPTKNHYPYTYANGKWNLDSFNTTFFSRYKNLITYANSKGIIVEVVIFSEYPSTSYNSNQWNSSELANNIYWRPVNNTQGVWSDVGGDLWPEFFTWDYTVSGKNLTNYQKALTSKVIDEFKPIGNVFFQVHNEYPAARNAGKMVSQVYQWQQNMADYFHNTKGAVTSVHAHEVGGMNLYGLDYWKTRPSIDILNFHPYSSSDNGNINAIGSTFGVLHTHGKVLMFDESHAFEDPTHTDTVTREMWAAFTNGIYYLAYIDDPFIIGSNDWRTRAGRIQTLKNVSELGDWRNATRNPSLVTTGPGQYWEGIANSGNFYVYYFTGFPSSSNVSITLPSGTYNYKWYDTRTWNANGVRSGQVTSSGTASIASPPTNSWAGSTGVVLTINKTGTTPADTAPPSGSFTACSPLTPATFSQSGYNAYASPFDLFAQNALLVSTECHATDPHTVRVTLGKAGDTSRISYTKGYYYNPASTQWIPYTGTCNGTMTGDWCAGHTTATITNQDISTTGASSPVFLVGYACSLQGGAWKCGCKDTACATPQWQLQAAGK